MPSCLITKWVMHLLLHNIILYMSWVCDIRSSWLLLVVKLAHWVLHCLVHGMLHWYCLHRCLDKMTLILWMSLLHVSYLVNITIWANSMWNQVKLSIWLLNDLSLQGHRLIWHRYLFMFIAFATNGRAALGLPIGI